MRPEGGTLPLPPLYPITDARLDLPLAEQVRRFGQAGFPLVQFRGKPLDAGIQWKELREALLASAEGGGWPLVAVNDRADLTVLAAAEGLAPWGLHLGQEDLPASEARRLPGLQELHVGASTHGSEEWEGVDPACDHAGVGPLRATATKADHAAPIGFEGLAVGCEALRARGCSPIAIGGLGIQDAGACFRAGAESLAMVSGLAQAPDPASLLWEAQAERWRARPPVRRGRSVVLAGSSGAGKSTLGPELAARLGLPFLDLDEVVEGACGLSVAEIFGTRGEAAFRALEAECAERALGSPGLLALGGGAWEVEGVRAAAARGGAQALWLAERPELCWTRVCGDPARPLAGERGAFMARHRRRLARWSGLPALLPLGRGPSEVASALCAALD